MKHPKHILNELNIRPRKKWGQNFLVYENNVRALIEFSGLRPGQTVLEIGPGLGAMSEHLFSHADQYTGVEFDPILCGYLKSTYVKENVTWVHGDILKVDLNDILNQPELIIFGNLPYHITTPILETLFPYRSKVQSMVFLLQKEVVTRMIAQPNQKTYGRLSVWVQSLFETHKGPILKPACFMPQPDVDSQAIKLIPKSTTPEKAFFDFVQMLFQKRRKTIGSILKSHDINIQPIAAEKLGLRPENLSIEDFKNLFLKCT